MPHQGFCCLTLHKEEEACAASSTDGCTDFATGGVREGHRQDFVWSCSCWIFLSAGFWQIKILWCHVNFLHGTWNSDGFGSWISGMCCREMQDWYNIGKTNTLAASCHSDEELYRAGMDRSMAPGAQQSQPGGGTGHTAFAQSCIWRGMDQNPDQLWSCWRLAEGVVERQSRAQHLHPHSNAFLQSLDLVDVRQIWRWTSSSKATWLSYRWTRQVYDHLQPWCHGMAHQTYGGDDWPDQQPKILPGFFEIWIFPERGGRARWFQGCWINIFISRLTWRRRSWPQQRRSCSRKVCRRLGWNWGAWQDGVLQTQNFEILALYCRWKWTALQMRENGNCPVHQMHRDADVLAPFLLRMLPTLRLYGKRVGGRGTCPTHACWYQKLYTMCERLFQLVTSVMFFSKLWVAPQP